MQGSATELGRFFAQELTDQLVQAGVGLALIDRTTLDYLKKENNLSDQGFINPKTRQQYGRMLGIDTLIIGTTTPVGPSIRLNIRAISVETGAILATQSTTLPGLGEIGQMQNHGLVTPTLNSSSPTVQGDFRAKLRPGSVKLVVRDIMINSRGGYWQDAQISVSFSLENLTSMGILLALVHDNASVGPCSGSILQASSIQFLYGNNIAQVTRDLRAGETAYTSQALRWLPSGAKVSASFTLLAGRCAQSLAGTADVAMSAVVAVDKDILTLPLSGSGTPE